MTETTLNYNPLLGSQTPAQRPQEPTPHYPARVVFDPKRRRIERLLDSVAIAWNAALPPEVLRPFQGLGELVTNSVTDAEVPTFSDAVELRGTTALALDDEPSFGSEATLGAYRAMIDTYDVDAVEREQLQVDRDLQL